MKAKTAPLPALARIADELGVLEKEYALAMAPFEMKLPRMKALREALQIACPAAAGDEWTVEGERFGVNLTKRAQERTINFTKLVKAIGEKVFAKFATCTLAALEQNVAAAIAQSVVSTDRTGPRKLTTFEKGA